jgi:formylglycine-generating enzyme required for sulfatase activity
LGAFGENRTVLLNMKHRYLLSTGALAILLFGFPKFNRTFAASFVYESERELVSTGDFDGDGRDDVIIVDKESGKYRVGYQQTNGFFYWANFRLAGMKYISSISPGKVLATDRDAVAFASADANQLSVIDAKDPATASPAQMIPFNGLGPNGIVAIDIGGAGNTPIWDLYVSSMYNSDPTPNRLMLIRSTGGKFSQIAEMPLSGTVAHVNRVSLKSGQTELVASLMAGNNGDTFRAEDLGNGAPVAVASATGLTTGSDYIFGSFRGNGLHDFLFYKAGENQLNYRPVEEQSQGKFQFGAGQSFDLGQPIRQAFAVAQGDATKLLFIFGDGKSAALYDFDGKKAPTMSQTVTNRAGDLFFGAAPVSNGFVVLSAPPTGRYSAMYHVYRAEGGSFVAKAYGSLPSLQDTDDVTVPEVYQRIMANLDVKEEGQMKAYTNTIPGSTVNFVMMPIPAGEFVMGSSESEPGHKPEEGPQHKVRISPFWMARCEITWNEYELFMYPEDEKKLAKATSGDTYVDNKLADAVTRPSKPYVEMSFGMGKYGYPAISMTQHAANKYCHWLSAKTGQFYRLPTEAEWEYACRAGTKTAYFFGDDADKLDVYAWYAKNSDFKYQKVGKKKPNPWGLCDMYGNVVEWCLDQYDPNFYKQFGNEVAVDPWNRATKPYPHVVRGGSWDDDDPALLRSAARRGSERAWKAQDPQLPKSIWYHSDAQFVGFRIIRPLKVPPPEVLVKYWTSGVEKD